MRVECLYGRAMFNINVGDSRHPIAMQKWSAHVRSDRTLDLNGANHPLEEIRY